jgi:hypothetical protein
LVTGSTAIADRGLAYVVIQAQAIWSEFVRSYYLSLLLTPYCSAGNRIVSTNATIRTEYDAISELILRLSPRKPRRSSWSRYDEPPWHKPSVLVTGCQVVGSPVLSTVLRAVSLPTYVFDDLPRMRNFYAHRNAEAARAALAVHSHYGVARQSHPTMILTSRGLGRSQSVIEDWIDDLQNAVYELCLA